MSSYLVTYIVHDSPRDLHPQFMVSHTEDFATNLRAIVGRRGVLKKLVHDYQQDNYVPIPGTNPHNRRVISHINIAPLSEEDKQVLNKYFWPTKILARLLGV